MDRYANFIKTLKKCNLDSGDENLIIELLVSYFSSVTNVIAHSVPKIIMNNIVRQIQLSLLSFLIHTVVTEQNLTLLREDENVEKMRNYYTDLRNKINSIKTIHTKLS